MVEYKKASPDDAEALARIRSSFLLEINDAASEHEHSQVEAANRAYFEAALAKDEFTAWIALDGDKIIATSGLCFYTVPPSAKCLDGKVAYIMNMYTFPDYRGQGIATELLSRILDEAKMRGYKKITLNATDMGKPLYEKHGFTDTTGAMELYVDKQSH